MAMCDYYLCDVCGGKCFYDAAIAEYTDDGRYLLSGSAVDIAAVCESCAKTHQCIAVPRGSAKGIIAALNIECTCRTIETCLRCEAINEILVGSHGNQSVSEASGSAQSEAQKESI